MKHLNKTLVVGGILLAVLGLVVIQTISGQATTVQASGPDASIDSGVTWGPTYYDDDTNVAPRMSHGDLDLMKQVDEQALTGKRWSPSYNGADTIVVPETNLNDTGGITWGPSYYADDTVIEAGRSRNELDMMRQVDQNALQGVSEGPSYHK